MKMIVFILVPIVVARTEIQVAVQSEHSRKQAVANNDAARDEVYPFWTWFIDNPRPQLPK
jgi:hypothetical protein